MPREFNVPQYYRSPSISLVKRARKTQDARKRDLSPTVIDFGPVRFKIARHFGFCFGVENAIEIAYRAIQENPTKRIFLLSEMIHNPQVNSDLIEHGVQFLMDTHGNQLIPFTTLTAEDIVIVPAFGTTLELQSALSEIGIDPYYYDTTCPFVEKVWKRSGDLGRAGFTVIVHGKSTHEETRATFSHSRQTAPTLVILDMADAHFLTDFIRRKVSINEFNTRFKLSMSEGFDATKDLLRVGVVNQTTMLATETQAIANTIKEALSEMYGAENIKAHFADTRDTLCYATYENQSATRALMEDGADLAIVVGGYNSSNTSHLVELCEEQIPTYYIQNSAEIIDRENIRHFDLKLRATKISSPWLPTRDTPLDIALTSGASCPDQTVDQVISRIINLFPGSVPFETAFMPFMSSEDSDGLVSIGSRS